MKATCQPNFSAKDYIEMAGIITGHINKVKSYCENVCDKLEELLELITEWTNDEEVLEELKLYFKGKFVLSDSASLTKKQIESILELLDSKPKHIDKEKCSFHEQILEHFP